MTIFLFEYTSRSITLYACSNYFFQGFFLFKLIWLHYWRKRLALGFFLFCFPFFILLLHGFCFMFLFFIFYPSVACFILSSAHISYFVFVASRSFSLASLDNVFLWLHLIRFLWLQLVFSPHFNKALWHLETSFKTGAFFFGCDWFINLSSTRVFTIWNQLSNLRFLPSNWFFGFASKTTTLTGVQCK